MRPTDKQSPLMPRCEHITAEHRQYRNGMKFPSRHAEMIADQTNGKAYANRTNSAALAGASDIIFDESCRFLPHRTKQRGGCSGGETALGRVLINRRRRRVAVGQCGL